MNLPNRLTLFRIVLILPFFILIKLSHYGLSYDIGACVTFIVASLTDFFDGYIARKENLVTDFGKLMDPLADKVLVISALILFVENSYIPSWMLIVIITREFLVTGIRVIAASKGNVISAGTMGKYKTATQMIVIMIIIFLKEHILSQVIMLVPIILTVWSGYEYVYNAKKYFKNT